MLPATYALSLHAEYRCGHSGACCTSNWPIHVEPAVEQRIRVALSRSALRVAGQDVGALLVPTAGLPDGARVLAGRSAGRCVFFEPEEGNLCALHRQLGEEALPVSCREYPRAVVLTPRGASITLSHYCPTAAAALFVERPLLVLRDPPAFPRERSYEGLDARGGLPPLLRPDALFDWDTFHAWEAHAVATFARADLGFHAALARLSADAERLRAWTPARGTLRAWLDVVIAEAEPPDAPARIDPVAAWREVRAAAPEPYRPPDVAGVAPVSLEPFDVVVRRYLAARAFASRAALEGQGVRTFIRSLYASLAVLMVEAARADPLDEAGLKEAVRRADLLLVHLADPTKLASTWSTAER